MSRHQTTMGKTHFENLYANDPDPWRFATSDYERTKYAATLAALPEATYPAALEIGCSIGILTRQIAMRCESLLALDLADNALRQATQRCADMPHVSFARMQVPGDWPAGSFGLVLLSEVIYFLDEADLVRLVARIEGSVSAHADIVLVHWLGETNFPLSGDEAAEIFIARAAGFARLHHQSRTEDYRLDVLRVC